jgi:hypothetical protein
MAYWFAAGKGKRKPRMRSKMRVIMSDRSLYAMALISCAISALGQNQTIGPNGEGSFKDHLSLAQTVYP